MTVPKNARPVPSIPVAARSRTASTMARDANSRTEGDDRSAPAWVPKVIAGIVLFAGSAVVLAGAGWLVGFLVVHWP